LVAHFFPSASHFIILAVVVIAIGFLGQCWDIHEIAEEKKKEIKRKAAEAKAAAARAAAAAAVAAAETKRDLDKRIMYSKMTTNL
jgi:Na+-transporting methylmalonyl-CoA/oxaloacetate decarboxylase gamma subunit